MSDVHAFALGFAVGLSFAGWLVTLLHRRVLDVIVCNGKRIE